MKHTDHPTLTSHVLAVRFGARAVSDGALVVHYTSSPYHLKTLEADMERLDRDLAGLRMALQAVRSRGEEPLS